MRSLRKERCPLLRRYVKCLQPFGANEYVHMCEGMQHAAHTRAFYKSIGFVWPTRQKRTYHCVAVLFLTAPRMHRSSLYLLQAARRIRIISEPEIPGNSPPQKPHLPIETFFHLPHPMSAPNAHIARGPMNSEISASSARVPHALSPRLSLYPVCSLPTADLAMKRPGCERARSCRIQFSSFFWRALGFVCCCMYQEQY